jgi:CIC family chloride channel protein
MSTKTAGFVKHRLLRKYLSLIHEDLTAVYARDLRKWLIVAPVIGLTTGLGSPEWW